MEERTINSQSEPQMYFGKLRDDMDMSMYFYDLPTTPARRNRHIYPATGKGGLRVVNLPEVFSRLKTPRVFSEFINPGWHESIVSIVTKMVTDTAYLPPLVSNLFTPVSIWIVADFDKRSGETLLKDALSSMVGVVVTRERDTY